MKKFDNVTLNIHRFNEKGHGLAIYNERKVCVPYALPEESVEATLFKKKRSEWEAKLTCVVSASESRVNLKCAHAGVCGGCQLQQLSYSAQLKQKQTWISDLFAFSNVEVLPILGCDPYWNYRNKMEYSFSQNREGQKFLGLLKQGAPHVENITECHIAPVWFSDCLNSVRTWWLESHFSAFNPRKGEGLLRTLTLRESVHTQERMITLTCHFDPLNIPSEADKKTFLNALDLFIQDSRYATTIVLKTHIAIKGQPTTFSEEVLHGKGYIVEELKIGSHHLKFKISPDAFFQPNPVQAERLFEKALELSKINQETTVLDLYSGTGVLGLVASLQAKKVLGIELNSSAVKDAQQNIQLNGVHNFEIVEGDVGATLKALNLANLPPLTIFVDPPRTGLNSEALEQICSLSADKIVYISCNPRTQAPNVAFLQKRGYQIDAIQPVDQFPHTYHIENIVILSKSAN